MKWRTGRWSRGGLAVIAAGGLGACAHESARPGGETASLSGYEMTEAQPVAGQAYCKPATMGERQPVAGHEGACNVDLSPQGTFETPTGKFQEQHGQVLKPQGTYGELGQVQIGGTEGVKGTYGTYQKQEGTFRRPESVEVVPQGKYMAPFGGEPQAIGSEALGEKMPVAGRDSGQGYFIVRDASGKNWQIQNTMLIKDVEQKLSATGYEPGKVDGVADQQFGSALIKFQAKNGLPTTGVIDQQTARALGVDWSAFQARIDQLRSTSPALEGGH